MKKAMLYMILAAAAFPAAISSCKSKVDQEAGRTGVPSDNSRGAHGEAIAGTDAMGGGGTDTADSRVVLDSAQKGNAGLMLDTAVHRWMHHVLRASGNVDVPPQSLVSVSFPLGGYLVSTPLLPGYKVSRGQQIAVMEDQSYVQLQQDYLVARAKMEYLSADKERQKELSDADATSRKSYQSVLSEYKVQEVLLHSLAEKLRIIHIDPEKLAVNTISRTVPVYSPISGYVTRVNVNIGKYVNPSDVLFELVNPDDIHAAITVFEKDISQIRQGVKGKVSLVDRPEEWFDVETILVTKNVNDNRSGLIHCHFEKPMHGLLPGMYLNAVFELDSKRATAVPEEAVVRYQGRDYVFTSRDGRVFRMVEIGKGERENGFVEIQGPAAEGGPAGERIVMRGAYALLGKLKNRADGNE